MGNPDDLSSGSFASPPCLPGKTEGGGTVDAQTRRDILRWRRAERERQITARLAMPADVRTAMAARIAEGLDRAIGEVSGHMISLYWPFRGEPDLRPWMESVAARGGHTALPVVVEKGRPLIFRAWKKGQPLAKGVWNIPVPATGPNVLPDIVIAPLVGFDRQNFRLGYGGGFFDRTLAATARRPMVIGVGYARSLLPTICPLAHDIAMDAIITESR